MLERGDSNAAEVGIQPSLTVLEGVDPRPACSSTT
jgi:hypothetical protein